MFIVSGLTFLFKASGDPGSARQHKSAVGDGVPETPWLCSLVIARTGHHGLAVFRIWPLWSVPRPEGLQAKGVNAVRVGP